LPESQKALLPRVEHLEDHVVEEALPVVKVVKWPSR